MINKDMKKLAELSESLRTEITDYDSRIRELSAQLRADNVQVTAKISNIYNGWSLEFNKRNVTALALLLTKKEVAYRILEAPRPLRLAAAKHLSSIVNKLTESSKKELVKFKTAMKESETL